MDNQGKKQWVDWSTDNTQLFGVNVGIYPEHHLFFVPRTGIMMQYPFYVCHGGYDVMCQGVFRQRKNCNVCSFELVTEGEVLFESNGSVYHCHPGDIFIMQLHSSNRLECLTPLCKTQCIGYDGEQLMPILKQLGLSSCEFVHLDRWQEFVKIVERLAELHENLQPEHFPEMASLGYAALLLVAASLHRDTHIPPQLYKIVAYMNANLEKKIRLEDLARRFSVSQGTIFRLFNLHFQCAPNEYLTRIRIDYARRMLMESTYSIKEISVHCGFCNQLYFTKVFKERIGMSPAQFRKSN